MRTGFVTTLNSEIFFFFWGKIAELSGNRGITNTVAINLQAGSRAIMQPFKEKVIFAKPIT